MLVQDEIYPLSTTIGIVERCMTIELCLIILSYIYYMYKKCSRGSLQNKLQCIFLFPVPITPELKEMLLVLFYY